MNCKPGDLARVVAPYVTPGRGAFVTVVKAADRGEYRAYGSLWEIDGPAWVCEGWVRDVDGVVRGPLRIIGDRCLCRVDPGRAEEETPAVAELPQPVEP